MTQNLYDLLVGISVALYGLADTISIYLLATGKIDGKTAAIITDVTVTVTGLVLGTWYLCSLYSGRRKEEACKEISLMTLFLERF